MACRIAGAMQSPQNLCCSRAAQVTNCVWLGICLVLAMYVLEAKGAIYSSRFNKTCRYSAKNVSSALFKHGVEGGLDFLMPLEGSMVVGNYGDRPWQACFGPNEKIDVGLIQNGKKLPCFYEYNQWGNIDYWEENACDILLRSNCYCYSVGTYVGSYCEPGLGSTGKAYPLPVRDCNAAVAGVIADGGKPVDRWTVYNKQQQGTHYIALAVKPAEDAGDSGDFHFWRLDDNKVWSYKAGDTLSRNTFRNGTLIKDVEAPEARGRYTMFCGYFAVQPDTHKLVGNSYYYSNLPARFKLWRDAAVHGSVVTLSAMSPAWLAAYKNYFADSGWEDGLYRPKESLRVAAGSSMQHLHSYSVRPMSS